MEAPGSVCLERHYWLSRRENLVPYPAHNREPILRNIHAKTSLLDQTKWAFNFATKCVWTAKNRAIKIVQRSACKLHLTSSLPTHNLPRSDGKHGKSVSVKGSPSSQPPPTSDCWRARMRGKGYLGESWMRPGAESLALSIWMSPAGSSGATRGPASAASFAATGSFGPGPGPCPVALGWE